MAMSTFDSNDIASDPFLCAALVAGRSGPLRVSVVSQPDSGAWTKCVSCTDPGFDYLPHPWPGEPDAPNGEVHAKPRASQPELV
jgi:hypothetical protein